MSNLLRLNKCFYNEALIVRGAEAYQKIAKITVEEEDDYWNCNFQQCVYSDEETIREFENYLICLMNSKVLR